MHTRRLRAQCNCSNKALLSDKFSAALQICRRARRYVSLGDGFTFENLLRGC